MGQWITWTVTAPSLDKISAAALAIEFWTGLGFEAQSSSYNRLVFRRNRFGSAMAVLEGVMGEEGQWDEAPLELTVLTQALPSQVKYTLKFELGFGWQPKREGDFTRFSERWIDDFVAFINTWTTAA